MDFLNWEELIGSIFTFVKSELIEILVSLLIIFMGSRLLMKVANQFVNEDRRRYKLKKSTRYVTSIVMVLWLMLLYSNYSGESNSFFLFLIGVILAGVAFTLRDVFSNVVGWMIIASHNGFQSGDRIEINEVRGDVIDVGVLRTTIAEIGDWEERGEHSTGRLVSIPNSRILQEAVVNYNRGFETIWNEISVVVTFESAWEAAEQIIEEIAYNEYENNREKFHILMKRVKRDYMVSYNYLTPKVYVTIIDCGVKLTLRHMVEVRKRRSASDLIYRDILRKFSAHEAIDFAYPTTRFYTSKGRGE